ncbi:Microtubule-associated protein 1A [Linum perenne]
MSWDMSSDTHFLDNLGNRNSISVCVLKQNWDAYSAQPPWGGAFVGPLQLSGELKIHGVVIKGQMLRDLYNDLYNYQCRVNRDGFCFFYISSTDSYKRLNDMFPWYKYGVQPRFITIWDRLEITNDRRIILGSLWESNKIKAELEASKKRELGLSQQIQAKDKVLKEKEQELIKKDEMIQAKDKVKDKILKEKEEEITKKDETIQAKYKILEKREEELTKKDETIEAKDKMVKEKVEELIKKDKIIQILKNTVDALIS